MAEGKIDYGRLANKLAGDAGKVTRKLIDFGVSVVKPENIAKVGGAVKGLADSAIDGWKAAGAEDSTETTDETVEPTTADEAAPTEPDVTEPAEEKNAGNSSGGTIDDADATRQTK